MKTAVPLPDDPSKGAEPVAQRNAPEQVTDAMDRICLELAGEPGGKRDEFVSMGGRRVLERTEW
jgi:hypothetical protein